MTIANTTAKENSEWLRDPSLGNNTKELVISDNITNAQLHRYDKESQTLVIENEDCVIVPATDVDKNAMEEYSIKNKISRRRKWVILSIVALQGFLGPLTSSIYVPAIAQVKQSLNTSNIAINVTISLYVFIMGVAPLIWAALSERYGRRAIYLLATLLYVSATIGCALSNSIALFIVLRALQATGASAAQVVGAGTITDLFEVQERGSAMGFFLLGPLIGPVVGPITGGLINEFVSWRYIFWFLSIMGGLIFILILFALPETSALILKKRAQLKQAKELGIENRNLSPRGEHIWTSMTRPFKFVTKPVVILATTPYSMAYGFMYFMIASLPLQLTSHYDFLSYQIGLAYLPNGMGNAIGAYISGKLADRAIVEKDNVKRENESRLTPMWIGILVLPTGLLMYGWCVQFSVHVAATVVGLFLLGFGVGIVQTPCNTYIVDSYQKHSASVMSAANLMRCVSAGCTPLVAPRLLATIGDGWSTTILAILSLMSGICIYMVQRYGTQWRQKEYSL